MFGTPRRMPRPVLLIIVFGAFLAIVGVTAMAQIVMVSAHFTTSALNSVVGTDAALVRMFVTTNLSPDDLAAAGVAPTRAAELQQRLATLTESGEILRIEIRRPDGFVLAASDPAGAGSTAPLTGDFGSALTGASAVAGI